MEFEKEDLFFAVVGLVVGVIVYVVVDRLVETRQAVDSLRDYVERVEVEFVKFTSKSKTDDLPSM
jgi:uncharacterized membrane-anchored protein YhcB (DUF1043 family)